MIWIDLGVNILANVICIALGILMPLGIYTITNRRKLISFFGIEKSKRLVVYISNLRVTEGGSIGIDQKARSYSGSAVAYGEMAAAGNISSLFRYFLPSISEKSDFISSLLIADIYVQTVLSPLNTNNLDTSASVIALGSPAYNIASVYIEKNLHPFAKFILGQKTKQTPKKGIEIVGDPAPGTFIGTAYATPVYSSQISASGSSTEIIQPSGTGIIKKSSKTAVSSVEIDTPTIIRVEGVSDQSEMTVGFVERIFDTENNRTIFYVAGLSEPSTQGAAYYLIKEWNTLNNKFGQNQRFLTMLRFDPVDYRKYSVLFEKTS